MRGGGGSPISLALWRNLQARLLEDPLHKDLNQTTYERSERYPTRPFQEPKEYL